MKTTPVSCKNVQIKDGFWKERQKINRNVTLDAVFNRFDDTGKIDAFWCVWKPGDDESKKPHLFWDSDVAKWIEGASYILMHESIPSVEEKIDRIVDGIAEHMTNDGYFNVHYSIFGLSGRFTDRNNHELYCAGHHFEAACAYFEATGKDKYLRLMERFADLIYDIFVTKKSAFFVTPGHPEIELALIRLYRTVKNKKYLELCSFFIENRGRNDKDKPLFSDPKYAYDEVSLRCAQYADGHCVRTNYLMSGVCDLAYETGDRELYDACRRVLGNIANKRMYITGGQGSTYLGERYTSDYHLPNKSAYAETCASISLGMYAHRMGLFETDSFYGDIVERTLYNGTLSGVSLDGDSFFYENPLEIRNEDYAVDYHDFEKSRHYIPRTRQKMFGCSCCPPNILRLVASVGGYIYSFGSEVEGEGEGESEKDGGSKKPDVLFVHQYIPSAYSDGPVSVEMDTLFPKNGKIEIKVSGVRKIAVRIPYYCKRLEANMPYTEAGGYAFFETNENKTAQLSLDLGLCARFVYSNTNVYDNIGRAAVMYGPLVYCAETADNESVHTFFADTAAPIEVAGEKYGVPGIKVCGEKRVVSDGLYSEHPPVSAEAKLNMIPYFAFANRGECEMLTYLMTK